MLLNLWSFEVSATTFSQFLHSANLHPTAVILSLFLLPVSLGNSCFLWLFINCLLPFQTFAFLNLNSSLPMDLTWYWSVLCLVPMKRQWEIPPEPRAVQIFSLMLPRSASDFQQCLHLGVVLLTGATQSQLCTTFCSQSMFFSDSLASVWLFLITSLTYQGHKEF